MRSTVLSGCLGRRRAERALGVRRRSLDRVRAGARARSTASRRMALSKHFFVGASLSDTRTTRVLHAATARRRALRRRAGLRALSSRSARSRASSGRSRRTLIARLTYERIQNSDYHGAQTTNNGQVVASSPSRATSTSSATTTRRPARSSTSSSRTRPTAPGTSASTSASTGRRTSSPTVRLRHALADRHLRRRQVRPARLLRRRPERPERARLRRGPTATSTSRRRPSRRRRPSTRRSAPSRLLPPGRLRRHEPDRSRLQPDRGHAPPLVQAGRRQRLRAGGLGRQQDGRLRLVHRGPLRLRPQLRHRRPELAPLRRQVQHLAAEPHRTAASARRLLARRERATSQNYKTSTAAAASSPTPTTRPPDPATRTTRTAQPFTRERRSAQDVHRDADGDGPRTSASSRTRTATSCNPGVALRRVHEQVRHSRSTRADQDHPLVLRPDCAAGPLRRRRRARSTQWNLAVKRAVQHRQAGRGEARGQASTSCQAHGTS